MKYVYGQSIKKGGVGSSIVKVVFGSILFIIGYIVLLAGTEEGEPAMIIISVFGFLGGAALLLLFGIMGIVRGSKSYPVRDPNVFVQNNYSDPFFTVQCSSCGMWFDYQKSDLGFRAWYPDGYVECPHCKKPIRHNAQTNILYNPSVGQVNQQYAAPNQGYAQPQNNANYQQNNSNFQG